MSRYYGLKMQRELFEKGKIQGELQKRKLQRDVYKGNYEGLFMNGNTKEILQKEL